MSQRSKIRSPATYSVLTTIAVVAALVVSSTFGMAAVVGTAAAQSGPDTYTISQGDQCTPIEPLGDGHLPVEDFYDYRTPNTSPSSYTYSSHGTMHLQEDDTSSLFLYEGGDGLSLVLVHDRTNGLSGGGAVTMTLTNLPEEGEWVVEDDNYDGADDEFDHHDTSSRISWRWSEGRSDGAAFNGGLDDEFLININPRFNEDAAVQSPGGQIRDWDAISATATGHERVSLDMNRPVVIQSGSCSSYTVTGLSVNETVSPGESTTVEATVENDGGLTENVTVPFTVDGETVDEQTVSLEPGETATLSTTVSFDEAGTYTVGTANETTDMTVGSGDGLPGFGVTAVVVVALLGTLVVYRRL